MRVLEVLQAAQDNANASASSPARRQRHSPIQDAIQDAIAVALVSANEDPQIVHRALDHGAAGYIPKSAGLEDMRSAIRAVLACEQWLPPALRGACLARTLCARRRRPGCEARQSDL